ncbi:hypothetical protein DVR12_07840 [Chitinophaga silvatica]|uniref:Uncharacterized protein n=1 Tax=Chitinophaga silvatica TaxID=2282649 RepID=A0A3E1YEX6_9BACT|nr:hypothetical protein [Chitinophaga silvatica]RFS25086.1 hypothetical protein DVR12_07840 [Chitinophaga silvatica]
MNTKNEVTIKKILQQHAIQEPSAGFNERLNIQVTHQTKLNFSKKNEIKLSYGKVVLILLITLNTFILFILGLTALTPSVFIPLIFLTISVIITMIIIVSMVKKKIITDNQD